MELENLSAFTITSESTTPSEVSVASSTVKSLSLWETM